MKRSAIPTPSRGGRGFDGQVNDNFLSVLMAMKENIELLTGQRGGKLSEVPSTASLADVIVALNKVIDRLS